MENEEDSPPYQSSQRSHKAAQQILSIGQLVDLEWKLGVAATSSNCKELASPFVSLVMHVADSNSKVTAYPFELSLPEFQEFASNLKDVANLLDSL
ncbi:COMM domain-containing protein 6 [Balamuthia mandrillaris]